MLYYARSFQEVLQRMYDKLLLFDNKQITHKLLGYPLLQFLKQLTEFSRKISRKLEKFISDVQNVTHTIGRNACIQSFRRLLKS